MQTALYMRVSKDDGSLTTANQLPACRTKAATYGAEEPIVYEEQMSAAKRRPVFERMLEDGKAGRFQVLVIWAIDRFGRSMVGNLQDITALDRAGVRVASVQEAWLDTTGPTRLLLLGIFSWVAEQERARLIERTRAGLARARAAGKRLGAAQKVFFDEDRARRLLAEGWTYEELAREFGAPRATIHRRLSRAT